MAQGYRKDNPAGDAISAALPKSSLRRRHQRALPQRRRSSRAGARFQGTPGHGVRFRVPRAHRLPLRRGSRCPQGRGGRRRRHLDRAPGPHQGKDRAPGTPSSRAVAVLDEAPTRRSSLPVADRPHPQRQHTLQAAARTGSRRRPAPVPLELPRLGPGKDGCAARGSRTGARRTSTAIEWRLPSGVVTSSNAAPNLCNTGPTTVSLNPANSAARPTTAAFYSSPSLYDATPLRQSSARTQTSSPASLNCQSLHPLRAVPVTSRDAAENDRQTAPPSKCSFPSTTRPANSPSRYRNLAFAPSGGRDLRTGDGAVTASTVTLRRS